MNGMQELKKSDAVILRAIFEYYMSRDIFEIDQNVANKPIF